MSKKLLAILIVFAVLLLAATAITVGATTTVKATLNVSVVTANQSNDVVKTLNENYNGISVYSTLDDALAAAETNETKGIMVLADNYPTTATAITDTQAATIESLGVRVYVEYPANSAALGITGFDGTGTMGYDRAVVTDADALGMQLYSILYAHGAQYMKKTDISNSWLVNATVVGYDAVSEGFYDATTGELTDCTPYSMLEVNEGGNVLIASTKLSQFITGRYAPYARWQTLWHKVFSWVAGVDSADVNAPEWTPSMNANYGPDEELADDAYSEAVRLNIEWFLNSSIMPNSDGTEGIYECFRSGNGFNPYGDQYRGKNFRSDCNAESLGAIALAGALLGNEEYKTVAANVMDWLLNESELANGDRANVNMAQYGLLSWHSGAMDQYYGDDNAKAIIGLILGATALETDEYDQRILEAILANFRTTGTNGFRGAVLKAADLEANGWEYYYNRSITNYQSHFESLLWACYLWAYNQTGYEPLLERSRTAIGLMMSAYDNTMAADADNSDEWYWTNGLQQERAKMLLPLAWLVRVEPTDEHIGWLDKMVTDLIAYQDEATGALREAFGENGVGVPVYTQFSKNSDYGKHESPVISSNGDPCSDSLYTTGFAVMALNEAYAAIAATGDATTAAEYQGYAEKLSDYHVRIQQISQGAPQYNGAWFRGFDYEKWEVYGSDGDAGWGIWCVETGWCQSWISSTLSLQAMGTNMWDYTADSRIDTQFTDTAMLMLDYEPGAPTVSSDVALSQGAVTVLLDGVYGGTTYNDGKWTGIEGPDINLTFDLQYSREFDSIVVGSLHNMSMGISNPQSIAVSISDDGVSYTPLTTWTTSKVLQDEYNNCATIGAVIERINIDTAGTKARYVKLEVKNPGTFTHASFGTCKTWMFLDEVEFKSEAATRDDLLALVENASAVNLRSYQPGTALAFDEAYRAAVAFIASGSNDADGIQAAYDALNAAFEGLKSNGAYTVSSASSNWSNATRIDRLTDGLAYDVPYVTGKLITNLSTLAEQQLELIVDMGSTTGIYAIGYIAQSRPNSGIYLHDAEYFISDSVDGPWTSVGTVYARTHNGSDPSTAEYRTLSADASGAEGRYVKVVFSRNADVEITSGGSVKRAEWLYLCEILINEYREVSVSTENATATLTDTDGNEFGVLGPRMGQDVLVNITPDMNAFFSSATVDGTAVAVTDNTVVITEPQTDKAVVIAYSLIPEEDLPTIKTKDLFFATGSSPDLLFDVRAFDKNGKDISSFVTVVSENVGTAAGKYSVTYQVTDEFGGTRQASANVYLVAGLGGKHVVASTTLSSRLGNHQINIQKLVDGKTPADGTNCWDSTNIYWQNEAAIEVVIYLGGEIGIADLGYSLLGCPSMGIIAPDVELYYSSDVAGGWTHAGTIEANYHAHTDLSSYEYIYRTMALKNVRASYVKAIIKFDDDPELRARYVEDCADFTGKGTQEWTFANEIVINPYYRVTSSEAEGGSVSITTDNPEGALWGESATVTVAPDAGCTVASVTVNGTPVALVGNTYTISSITEHMRVEVIFASPYIKSATVKLGESISMLYYAVYDADTASVTMQFVFNGDTYVVDAVSTEEDNVYVFEFKDVAPQLMGELIDASLLSDGVAVDTVEDYSIRSYCDATLEKIESKSIDGYTDAQYAALRALIVDMLEYGAAAQTYRGYNTESLVNEGITGAREFVELDGTSAAVVGESTSQTLYLISGGVRFDYLNHMYFKLSAPTVGNVTVRITGDKTGTVEYTLSDCTHLSESEGIGSYLLYSDGIAPTDYDEVFTVELCLDGEVVQTLEYSIAAYVYYIQNKTDAEGELTAMAALARAMYCFGISAGEYKTLV